MPGPDYETLRRRRRIWGVPPDAVERLAAEYARAGGEQQARIRELETRLTGMTAERDEASQAAIPLRERIEQLEQERAETVGRAEMVREEALRFVVDAWGEAQTIREQTRQETEKAEAAAREEAAAIHRSHEEKRARLEAEMEEVRRRYEAEIAMLRERRRKAIADLESLAESLLSQAARGSAAKPPDTTPEVAPNAMGAVAAPPPPPAREDGDPTEDRMLAKALDDLESVLSAPRKQNGSG